MNKEREYYKELYLKSDYCTILSVYKNPSDKKRKIQENILKQCLEDGGYRFRILTYNRDIFTCAYKIDISGVEYIKVFTPKKQLFVKL